MEFSLLFAALTGVLAGWLGLRVWNERLPAKASDRLIAATLFGLVSGRLFSMISQGVNPITHVGEFIVVRGGVDTAAASIGFVAALFWLSRENPADIDAVAPSIVLALAGWHAGCLWRGSCLGAASDLPWAWSLESSSITRHPVEIYAALGLLVASIVISRLPWRLWLRFGVGLSAISLVRLATEPLRPSLGGGTYWIYVAGIASGALVALLGPRILEGRVHSPT